MVPKDPPSQASSAFVLFVLAAVYVFGACCGCGCMAVWSWARRKPTENRKMQTEEAPAAPQDLVAAPTTVLRRCLLRLPEQTYVAPHRGERYHLDGQCKLLRDAREVRKLTPCSRCCPGQPVIE